MQLRGLVLLLHEYPIMTDYRGINSLFNQQTTYPACRLSNKIWRPWPRAPNDSLPFYLPPFLPPICTILHPFTHCTLSALCARAIFNGRLTLDYFPFPISFLFSFLFLPQVRFRNRNSIFLWRWSFGRGEERRDPSFSLCSRSIKVVEIIRI